MEKGTRKGCPVPPSDTSSNKKTPCLPSREPLGIPQLCQLHGRSGTQGSQNPRGLTRDQWVQEYPRMSHRPPRADSERYFPFNRLFSPLTMGEVWCKFLPQVLRKHLEYNLTLFSSSPVTTEPFKDPEHFGRFHQPIKVVLPSTF